MCTMAIPIPDTGCGERRVLFVHDGPIYVGPDGIPRGVHYTDALIDRYMQLGPHLTFLLRSIPVPQQDADSYSPLRRDGFRFFSVPNVKSISAHVTQGRLVRRMIAEQVAAHDVVVCRLPSTLGRWAFWEARQQGKPVLVEFMACTWDALWHYSLKGKLAAPYYFLRNVWLMRSARHVVYVTEHFLQTRYPNSGKSIPCSNAVITPADPKALARRQQRIAGFGASPRIVLATIGATDVRYKNQDVVLRALRAMGDGRHRYLYRVIGPGDTVRLRKLAERLGVTDCIEFVGAVRHADIPACLDDTDIYIQPSQVEGLPRALVEAMSRGCAALGSRLGGIPELLPQRYLFSPNDVSALKSMITSFDENALGIAAQENLLRSQDYVADVLEARRRAFFEEFLADSRIGDPARNLVAGQ